MKKLISLLALLLIVGCSEDKKDEDGSATIIDSNPVEEFTGPIKTFKAVYSSAGIDYDVVYELEGNQITLLVVKTDANGSFGRLAKGVFTIDDRVLYASFNYPNAFYPSDIVNNQRTCPKPPFGTPINNGHFNYGSEDVLWNQKTETPYAGSVLAMTQIAQHIDDMDFTEDVGCNKF